MSKKDLKKYRDKRDFRSTKEPKGEQGPRDAKRFVIQKHDATSLHYDLRLSVNGILKSWSVPKGPSMDPSDKRLAIATEDHPYDYIDFEGTIPEDQYGGGKIIVWDKGPYKNLNDSTMEEALKKGKIEVELKGRKIKGGFALIKTQKKGTPGSWILVKKDDDEADARTNPLSTKPESVKSGKKIEDI